MQDPAPISELMARLADFAASLQRELSDPVIDWNCRPAEGEWCLTEVTCHLRDVEREVHQPRFRAVLAQPGTFLPGAVSDSWIEERAYREQSGPRALAEFLAARHETIVLLGQLSEGDWELQGQHAFFGPTSMHELLNLAVQHDAAHWEQIQELLSL